MIDVICVIGPTASGKTALGVSLAKLFNGEIVSADSMQIYRGMDISTAKPTSQEMCGIKHYMIDFVDTNVSYSVADYVVQANKIINNIHSNNKVPIIVGGTGLYVDSLLNNTQFADIKSDDDLRQELYQLADKNGIDYMLNILSKFDVQSAESLTQTRNLKRIIRAIEVYRLTGQTMTELNAKSHSIPSNLNPTKIGLTCYDRDKLYDRINIRVDKMVQNGLVDEAFEVYQRSLNDVSGTSAQAIGCKELFPYFRHEKTLQECIDKLKMETRRYAKRQLTWFKRDENIHWIFSDKFEGYEEILAYAKQVLIKEGFKLNG